MEWRMARGTSRKLNAYEGLEKLTEMILEVKSSCGRQALMLVVRVERHASLEDDRSQLKQRLDH